MSAFIHVVKTEIIKFASDVEYYLQDLLRADDLIISRSNARSLLVSSAEFCDECSDWSDREPAVCRECREPTSLPREALYSSNHFFDSSVERPAGGIPSTCFSLHYGLKFHASKLR